MDERQSCNEVLIVEDDTAIRESLKELLEMDGYEVYTAEHGRDALWVLREHKPAVILMDLMMPEMNGFEFLAQRRNDPEIAAIPVVVMTAEPALARRVGDDAAAVFSKPFDVNTLIPMIDAARLH